MTCPLSLLPVILMDTACFNGMVCGQIRGDIGCHWATQARAEAGAWVLLSQARMRSRPVVDGQDAGGE